MFKDKSSLAARVESKTRAQRPLQGRKRSQPDVKVVKKITVPSGVIHSRSSKSEKIRALFKSSPQSDSEEFETSDATYIAKCLVDPGQSYYFRLASYATVSSSGGGTLSGYQTFNPTGITEFSSYLQNLFNQVRLVEAKVHWTNVNPHSDGYAVGPQKFVVPVGCDMGLTATTPGSIAIVWECPNTKLVQLGSPRNTVIEAKVDRSITDFALCSAPVPGPYAGCYGQIQWYNAGLTVSTAYATIFYEGVYEFRSRT
jgi:hypothetical protein